MTIQIQGITLTSIEQLRQYLEGFLWNNNYEPIRFGKGHIRQMLEVTRNTETSIQSKDIAIRYALEHCPTCQSDKAGPELCHVCKTLRMTQLD